jgi:hypothetical protein
MTISPEVKAAAEALLARVERPGTRVGEQELQQLCAATGAHVPIWFVELVTEYPLAGLQVGIQPEGGGGDDDWPLMFEWADGGLLWELNIESYPGKYLFPRGYLAIGCGVEWAGNVLLLGPEGSDPPVYELWHDVSQDPDELERALREGAPGTRLIAATLSEFLSTGLAAPPFTP